MTTEYEALVEPTDNQFRATASAPFGITVFGLTEREALERLDSEVGLRLQRGAKFVTRHVQSVADGSPHPLARFAGDLADDLLADDWLAAMAAYRQEAENDPNYR